MGMFKRIASISIAACALSAVLAGQASAANVSSTTQKRLVFEAAPGEANQVTITASGTGVVVTDTGATLTSDTSVYPIACTLDSAQQATCPDVDHLDIRLGDMDDTFTNDTGLQSRVTGGAGMDTLNGGSGVDYLLGEADRDTINGGDGDDIIHSQGGAIDAVNCGPGRDTVVADSTDFLDASCDDGDTQTSGGPPGQGEAPPPSSSGPPPVLTPSAPGVPSPIPVKGCPVQFIGTPHADRIDGTGAGDRLYGMGSADVLNGLGGDDCLFGMAGSDALYGGEGNDLIHGGGGKDRVFAGPGADRVFGDGGGDRLKGQSGNDRLRGGSGDDTLIGGAGNDRLKGDAGRNTYSGGSGKDQIDARNGKRDIIDCGRGRDTARVDPQDRVRHCERVLVQR
jgi:Ca2+-binding RTX toxin-like protein